MKYIVLSAELGRGHSIELPIIFPDVLVHAQVAEHMLSLVRSTHGTSKVTVVSAGILSSLEFEGGCHGESTTLNIKSRGKKDDHLIKMHDYGSGHQC